MSVWVTIPSARPVSEVNEWGKKWLDMGYKVAVQRDPGCGGYGWDVPFPGLAAFTRPYSGYAEAVNYLTSAVFGEYPGCDWCVACGDDTLPDPTKRADQIAAECSGYFAMQAIKRQHYEAESGVIAQLKQHSTYGVVQPTGDTWSDHQGRIIERIAGSPWLGREWCRRINGGQGPLWPEYTHCFSDEELQNVAQRLGVFWQRPDLNQHHQNWARARGDVRDKPAFLTEATSGAHWQKYSTLFKRRQTAGFPGSEPIA